MVQTSAGDWVAIFLACQPYSGDYYNTGRQTFFHPVDWSGDWPIILKKGLPIPTEVKSPLKAETGKVTFSNYSANWKDDFDQSNLKLDWNFIRTPQEKWYQLKDKNLVIDAQPISISEGENPSFIGRRLQFMNSEFCAAVSLENGKEMEAGLVAFQNEKYFYKLVILMDSEKYYLSLSSASGEILKTELIAYKVGKMINLRMLALADQFKCEYSLDNKTWTPFGNILDGKILSTHVSGGFVGAYFGLFAYAKTPAKATFDWATYKLID